MFLHVALLQFVHQCHWKLSLHLGQQFFHYLLQLYPITISLDCDAVVTDFTYMVYYICKV